MFEIIRNKMFVSPADLIEFSEWFSIPITIIMVGSRVFRQPDLMIEPGRCGHISSLHSTPALYWVLGLLCHLVSVTGGSSPQDMKYEGTSLTICSWMCKFWAKYANDLRFCSFEFVASVRQFGFINFIYLICYTVFLI